MADLRSMMEQLGYRDCRTLLNSGNIVFIGGRESPSRSATRIEQAISKEFGLDAPFTVLSAADFSTVISENPLTDIADNHSRLLFIFLLASGDLDRLEPPTHESWDPEVLALGSKHAAYLWIPNGVIDSRLSEAATRALDKAVTSRNWKTVLKIQSALGQIRFQKFGGPA